jgi:signal transduction histidine kinase
MKGRIAKIVARPGLPRRTVRLRLTLIYSGLFLISGAVLLTITYLLVADSSGPLLLFKRLGGAPRGTGVVRHSAETGLGAIPPSLQLQTAHLQKLASEHDAAMLHRLLVRSGIALAIMSVASIGLGWLMAGRVLRPLRTMTAATRRISHQSLHERLALAGPQDELKDLADTIDELLGRLESAFEAQRRFVANASHELRTPLAMMRTSLDVAAGKPQEVLPQVAVLDGKLREGLDQADRLLEGFLVLSRAEQGALEVEDAVSLRRILAEALGARQGRIDERRIEVRQNVADVRVRGNPTLLARLIANLIDNAVRHNHPGGWIGVDVSAADGVARIGVENSGPPLDEERVRELGRPFRRLGEERTGSDDGVGLGLSIVAGIAAAHGGELELRARRGGGLQVLIELPSVAAPVASGRST